MINYRMKNMLQADTLMTAEQREQLRGGAMLTSLGYILIDCANSCMMHAEERLDKLGFCLPMEVKVEWEKTKAIMREAKNSTSEFSRPLYDCKETDLLCEDSDWLMEIIIEVVNRTGNNEYARADMLEYIKRKKNTIKTTRKNER